MIESTGLSESHTFISKIEEFKNITLDVRKQETPTTQDVENTLAYGGIPTGRS
jgi:hypothetical protein